MKAKTLLFIFLLTGLAAFVNAQERQAYETYRFRTIIPTDKQQLLKNIDMFANTQLDFRSDWTGQNYVGSKFKFEQLRLEIKGELHKNIYFRFRHRYTSTFEPQTIDKIIKGVDFAYLNFTLGKRWKLTMGKMYADWGGIEFDLNPIDIYVYSDIIEYADNFLTGIEANYQLAKNHNVGLQLLNSRTGTFEDLYDTIPNVTASKVPLAIVFNWRGSFFDGKINTIWSYSAFTEAKGYGMNYFALGQQFHSKFFDLAYDFKYSAEDIDRTGIISDEIPDTLYNYAVKNTVYVSHWIRATYKLNRNIHLSMDAFVDFADWTNNADPLKTENRFRTVYSIIPTLEVYPWDDFDMKFYVGYVGRWYRYSDYAKTRPGLEKQDYSTTRIMIGMIS